MLGGDQQPVTVIMLAKRSVHGDTSLHKMHPESDDAKYYNNVSSISTSVH